jgi:hypothetical protein
MESVRVEREKSPPPAGPANAGSTTLSTVVELITPHLAEQYLEGISHQRNIHDWRVELYATKMLAGEWKLTSQGISFDTNGVLRNGQHRLWAVILSGCSVYMSVTRGEDTEAFHVIDVGATRTPGDIFSIYGESHSNLLAAAAKWQFRYQQGPLTLSSNGKYKPSHKQLYDIVSEHPGLREAIHRSGAISIGSGLWLLPPSLMTFLYYQFALRDEEAADEFFAGLNKGAELADDSPVRKLRETIINRKTRNIKTTSTHLAAITIKTWNNVRAGQYRQTIVWHDNEKFPSIHD